jgi:hypothetical protein
MEIKESLSFRVIAAFVMSDEVCWRGITHGQQRNTAIKLRRSQRIC